MLRRISFPRIHRHIDFGSFVAVLVKIDLNLIGIIALDDLILDVLGFVVVDRGYFSAHFLEFAAVEILLFSRLQRLLELVF